MVCIKKIMILRNPTDQEVSMQYLGLPYSVEAESTVEVEDNVGAHWLKIHEFLVVEGESTEAKPAKKTAKKEEEEEEAE